MDIDIPTEVSSPHEMCELIEIREMLDSMAAEDREALEAVVGITRVQDVANARGVSRQAIYPRGRRVLRELRDRCHPIDTLRH